MPPLNRTISDPAAQASDPLADIGSLDLGAMPRVLARLTRLAMRYRVRAALAIGCALASAVFNIVTPRLLGTAVDQSHRLLSLGAVQAEATRHALWTTALLLVAACAVRGAVTGAQGYLGESIAQRVGYDLRLAFYDQLQRLGFSFHDTHHSGDLIARGMLDLEGVRGYLESGLLRIVTLVLLVGVGAWRLMSIDPLLGLLALSFVPIVVWRAARMGVLLRLSWQKLQRMMSELTRGMEENLQGVRVVRAFGARDFELAKFDASSDAALTLSNRRITLRMSAMAVMNTAFYVSMGLVLWFGTHEIARGRLTVGLLTEVLTFMTLLQQPVRQVGMIVNAGARAASSGARLFEVLDATPDVVDAPHAKPLVVTTGVLRFAHVGFAYDKRPGSTPVLDDISFEVRAGRTLGIVGPPGSGKSTLAQLIARHYDVDRGRITIDGQDLRDVTLDSLRAAVGLIQQEVFLFDTTVHHNVAYVEPDASPERVMDASEVAQIHEHMVSLPEAYETRVGERGVALSGGQRQRVAIARGLVPGPAVVVFDDATSAIDAATEQQVRAGLTDAVRDKVTLIIAHRLGSLRHADEIIVLDAGCVVERGTHASLLALDGIYASLWRLQHRQSTEGGVA